MYFGSPNACAGRCAEGSECAECVAYGSCMVEELCADPQVAESGRRPSTVVS